MKDLVGIRLDADGNRVGEVRIPRTRAQRSAEVLRATAGKWWLAAPELLDAHSVSRRDARRYALRLERQRRQIERERRNPKVGVVRNGRLEFHRLRVDAAASATEHDRRPPRRVTVPRTSRRVVRTAPSRGDPSPSGDDDSPPLDPADLRQIGREAGLTHISEPLIEELERLVRETL
jgi:hypothetical protein